MVREAWKVSFTLLITLLALLPQVKCGGTVVEVDSRSLPKIIEKHKRLLLVEFYAPSCGHCVRLDPELDRLAKDLEGKVTIVKIDSRGGGSLGQKYGVKGTPTMLLFYKGQEITAGRKELQGYRTYDALHPFLLNHIGDTPSSITSVNDLDAAVAENGLVFVGLFESEDLDAANTFKAAAVSKRAHALFAMTTDSATAQIVAESYEIDELPVVFALKAHNHTVVYEGAMKESKLEKFINHNAFPLVGNFSVVNFYRYKNRKATEVLLFQDPMSHDKSEVARVKVAKDGMELSAVDLDDWSFMTVGHKASEEDGKKLLPKMGFTPMQFPVIGIRAQDFNGSLAFNALAPPTLETIKRGIDYWHRTKTAATEYKCMVSRNRERSKDYTPEVIEKYDNLAQREKSRLGLSDELIREVDMTTFHKQLKKSWKDVLIIYTARWCTYSTRMEEILHRMIRAGEFDDFEDEIQFVKIDVVLTQAEDFKALQTVPAIKYVSARYKDFPNWYGGRHDSADELVQFVHSYHSMRHVEIPGEGPSPYSGNARPKHTDDEGGLLEREADNVVF